MSWVEHHRRDQALRTVVEFADRRRDGLLPWDEIADAAVAFGTPEDLLATLQLRWYTRLSGSIDTQLVEQTGDLERGVVHAWRYAAADLPGIRAILDANLDHPAIAAGRRKELTLLATASELSWFGDPGVVAVGRQVEERARGVSVETSVRGAA
jgi:hypothetical protein